jgi:hypothetical protein
MQSWPRRADVSSAADLLDLGEIEPVDGLRDIIIEHPPDRLSCSSTISAALATGIVDHRKQESLEQQREARARVRPPRRNLLHTPFVARNPRDLSLQHRLCCDLSSPPDQKQLDLLRAGRARITRNPLPDASRQFRPERSITATLRCRQMALSYYYNALNYSPE